MGWGNEFVHGVWSHHQAGYHAIYGKNPLKIFFSGTKGPMTLGLGMLHQGLGPNKVCSNDDLGLTLTFFTARSNLLCYAVYMGKYTFLQEKC